MINDCVPHLFLSTFLRISYPPQPEPRITSFSFARAALEENVRLPLCEDVTSRKHASRILTVLVDMDVVVQDSMTTLLPEGYYSSGGGSRASTSLLSSVKIECDWPALSSDDSGSAEAMEF